jgi:uncharacterized protein involved in exopolysaccharide biosynthesis/Mrp family chromosome partitioning ATPase
MNPVQRPDSFEAADYTGVLRRRWWVVLAGACIGLVGAFAYVTVAPKAYTANTAVYVAATAADQGGQLANSRTGGTVNLDTEAQIVQSAAVATIAVKQLHSPLTPWQLSKQISVSVPPNSQVLVIACTASSGTAAAACAQAFATAYLHNRSAAATSFINAQINALQAKVTSLQKTASSLSAKISALPKKSSTRLSDLPTLKSDQSQLHLLTGRIGTLTSELADTSGGTIITPASPPSKPSSPKKSLVLPAGLAAGLVLGLIAAFIWDRRDKRIRDAQNAERSLGLPAMLSLPKDAFAQSVSLASPRSRIGQAFTELAHAVAATLGEGNHVLIVAGASPGPGGSVVATNLAATLARTHSDVVLVCADLNSSVAPEMLGLEHGPGLVEVMMEETPVREVVRGPAAIPGLWVITPGAGVSPSGYYIQYDRARAFTSQLRRDARFVIIEAEGVEDGADTFAFAEFSDAALITVEALRTHRDEGAECVRRLQMLQTPVIGVAVLPALGRRVKVRPPQQRQPRTRQDGQNVNGGAAAGRTHGDLSAMSADRVRGS